MIALNTTAVAWVIFAVLTIGWIAYYILNNASARRELGSEVEMAPNRKTYYDDETLEGSRLERVQLLGVLRLVVVVIGRPVYWVLEPGRQAGARRRRTSLIACATTTDGRSVASGADRYAGCCAQIGP